MAIHAQSGFQAYFKAHGLSTPYSAGGQYSLAFIGQLVQTQAMILAYIDVFVALAVIAGVMAPLAPSLRAVKRSGKPVAAQLGHDEIRLMRNDNGGAPLDGIGTQRHHTVEALPVRADLRVCVGWVSQVLNSSYGSS